VERASFCLSGETNLGPINCPRSERCCCLAATPTPTPVADAWWQGQGGDIYGNGVQSSVINSQFLSMKLPSGSGYSGMVVSGGVINTPNLLLKERLSWEEVVP